MSHPWGMKPSLWAKGYYQPVLDLVSAWEDLGVSHRVVMETGERKSRLPRWH